MEIKDLKNLILRREGVKKTMYNGDCLKKGLG